MAWISLLGGLLGGAGGLAGGKAGDKAAKRAERRTDAAYAEAKGQMSPYSNIGKQGLYSLAELMGIEGYRTPEERAYTELLAGKPTYTRPSGVAPSDFEKTATFGPAGATMSKQADLMSQMNLSGPMGEGGHFGPLKDIFGAKKKRGRQNAANLAASQANYENQLKEWEAKVANAKAASEQSLANYNPMVALQRTPGYMNRYNTGLTTAMNSQQAKGMDQSGRAMRELQDWGQGFASNEFQNEFNRRAGITDMGRQTDTGLANLSIGQASNLNNLGMSQAQNTQQMYQNLNDTLQGSLANYAYMRNRNNRNSGTSIENGIYGPYS